MGPKYTVVKSNSDVEILARWGYDGTAIVIHAKERCSEEMGYVLQCVERWGMVAGVPDGEDSAGRSKLRMATPEEVVDRAMQCVRLAFAKGRQEGLIESVPSWSQVEEKIKHAEDERKN